MEPVTTLTTAWGIAKTAGDISKKLYEFGKGLKDRDAKQYVDQIVDQLRELKQMASELEDENRERGKLQFKSDDFGFENPFRFELKHPDRPLCPKCFAKEIVAPMGEEGYGCALNYRRCLVCGELIEVRRTSKPSLHLASDPL
jgi:hypothetical protein